MGLFGLFGGANSLVAVGAEGAAAEEIARANRIAQRWKAYHGEHERQLKVRPGQPEDNVIVNYCRTWWTRA